MTAKREGMLLVISGPSGVGKGTIAKCLIDRNPKMHFSVSATTRKPRPGEIEGVHYFFKTEAEFQTMVDENCFLEYMQNFGTHHYGTPKAYVADQRAAGFDVILDIDVKGGMRVKQVCPDAVLIFIAPPTISELETRLIGRGTEGTEAMRRRLEEAKTELTYIEKYDYVVENDVIEIAVHDIENIVSAEANRVIRNQKLVQKYAGGK
ncbi:MAG: guanylate kinase [Eubacteriales bacterium]|nr:guanylate kinase [Eubacteriales bacterium]